MSAWDRTRGRATRTASDPVNAAIWDFDAQVEGFAPGLIGNQVLPYYLRIQAHLDRGRYSAFGVP